MLFWGGAWVAAMAQPQPCGASPEMTSFCGQACIICDINGYTGINNNPAKGEAPPGFCTGTVHHMQWIGFIAGSTNLKIQVTAFNCKNNRGLEVGIYRSLDCKNFQLVSNCNGDILPNVNAVFTNTVPLVIGQYYYFVMDGNQNDVCNYTIKVLEGSTQVNKLANSGVIEGNSNACSGLSEKYTLRPPKGATWFIWTLDGKRVQSGIDTTLSLDFALAGQHELCVSAANVCDTAPPVCQLIDVQPLPVGKIAASICPGDCFSGADTTLCQAGLYRLLRKTPGGCDSLVEILIEELPAYRVNLKEVICAGEAIYIGTKAFDQTGKYTEHLKTYRGCDSTVILDLRVAVCNIKSNIQAKAATCYQKPDGSLRFSVIDATPPVYYEWYQSGSATLKGSGLLPGLNTDVVIPGLPAGLYRIRVFDDYGHEAVLTDSITEPPSLLGAIQKSEFQGHNLACAGDLNGSLRLTASGGLPPYSLRWSTGATAFALDNLGAGAYTCTLTDASGCSLTVNTTLTEPPGLLATATFTDPDCSGQPTGIVQARGVRGGTPPYAFELNGAGISSDSVFRQLAPGNYTLQVHDANGCVDTVTGVIHPRLIPQIMLPPTQRIALAEQVYLKTTATTAIETYTWSPAEGLSCTDCPNPVATPFAGTTYTLVAVAPGGCTDTDSVRVEVSDRRRVYIPNTFSPNDDGRNDYFTLFGGEEVSKILTLQVWSRWGEQVFSARDLLPNEEQSGWNGEFRGRPMPAGVFLWTASVEFIDGQLTHYQGNVAIVR